MFLDFHIPGRSTRINSGVGKAIASFNILVPAPQREALLVDLVPTCVRGTGALLPAMEVPEPDILTARSLGNYIAGEFIHSIPTSPWVWDCISTNQWLNVNSNFAMHLVLWQRTMCLFYLYYFDVKYSGRQGHQLYHV